MPGRVRILILASLLCCALGGPAFGQAGLLRSQTDAITGAIQNQIRAAVRPRLTVRNAAGPVTRLAENADGRVLAIVYRNADLRIWDLANGVEQARRRFGGGVRALRVSGDGRSIALGTAQGEVILLNAANGTTLATLRGHRGPITAIAISRDGARIVSAGSDGTVRLWDARTRRPLAMLRGQPGVTALALSADGRQVVAGTSGNGVILWNAAANGPAAVLAGSSFPVLAVGFGTGGRIEAVGADSTIASWNAAGAPGSRRAVQASIRPRAARLTADGRAAAVRESDRQAAAIDLPSGRILRRFPSAPGSVLVDLDHRRVVSGGRDGIVRIWSLDAGTRLVEIISTANGWAALDGQGRFDGTPGGVEDVEWLAARQILPIDNFSEAYFEPGLVAKYVRNQPRFVAPAPSPVVAGIYLPPRVEIAVASGNYAAGAEVAVTVTAEDQGGGIGAIRLFQNGKLVPAERRTGERRDGSRLIRTYRIPLVAGTNRLAAVAANRQQIDGERARAEVSAAGRPARASLDIVVVGINRYRQARFNLDYGVSDAHAILQRLDRESVGLFKRAVAYKLTDSAATRARIIGVFNALAQLPPEDVLVVYLAGHGVIIDNQWYFLPQDVVFSRKGVERTGISAKMLRNLLARAGPQRILLMIDSCKAGGSVDPLATSMDRRMMRSVGRQAGVAILAGARADQSAAEIPRLGHGAFTYVVLQGLAGKAARRGGGRVTADELLSYATAALPGLTKSIADYVQIPVAWRRGEDFMIAR